MWILVRNEKLLINTDKVKRFYIVDAGKNAPDIRIICEMDNEHFTFGRYIDIEAAQKAFDDLSKLLLVRV